MAKKPIEPTTMVIGTILEKRRRDQSRRPLGLYRCKHCGKTVELDSVKAWVKSYCDSFRRVVHLMRVDSTKGK